MAARTSNAFRSVTEFFTVNTVRCQSVADGTLLPAKHWQGPMIVIGTMEDFMRKIGFAALAAFGLAMPLAAPAKAEQAAIVINSGDRDRDHDSRWHRDRDHHKVAIVVKHRHRIHDHD